MNEFTLPNGVLFDGILYNKAYLNEITGKQQNYLVNTKYKSPVDHVEHLLFDLLIDLRDESNKSILNFAEKRHIITHLMQIEDTQFLLIKLREITFGEKYFFDKIECTHCNAKNHAELNLSKLEVVTQSEAGSKIGTLPKCGLEIEYKPMNLSELKSFGSDHEKLLNNHITETIKVVLKRLGDKAPSIVDIENLKALDNEYITENAPKYNFLDNKITHTCSSCKADFEFDLGELAVSFFVRSRI